MLPFIRRHPVAVALCTHGGTRTDGGGKKRDIKTLFPEYYECSGVSREREAERRGSQVKRYGRGHVPLCAPGILL